MISSESDTKNVEVKTPTLREVLLAQPLNPIVPLVFKVVPTRSREASNAVIVDNVYATD